MNHTKIFKHTRRIILVVIVLSIAGILIACPVDPPKDKDKSGGGDDDNGCPAVGPTPTAPAGYVKPTTTAALRAHIITKIGASDSTEINTANLNYIDTSAITDMTGVFEHKVLTGTDVTAPQYHAQDAFNTFNGDISAWDTSSVTNMNNMFKQAYAFNGNICNWKTSKVETMQSMFSAALVFNQPIGRWNVSAVENMESMFESAYAYNQPIESWNVSAVKNMRGMFSGAKKFNQPLADWNVGVVTTVSQMFQFASEFNQNLEKWGNAPGHFNTRDVNKGGETASAFEHSPQNPLPTWCTDTPGADCS